MFRWLTNLFHKDEKRAVTPQTASVLLGDRTLSGVVVNEAKAHNIAAVRCAVRVISEGIASLPLIVYRKLAQGGKDRAPEHPLFDLLRSAPNPEQTAFTFWESALATSLVHGNFLAEIERQGDGRPVALWPLPVNRCRLVRENGNLRYRFHTDQGEVVLDPVNVFHLMGLGDGVWGHSVLELARESFGLALSLERYGAAFFGQASRPSGTLTYPGSLSDAARQNIRNSFANLHEGHTNAARIALLEEGLTFTPYQWNNEEYQFLESRRFTVEEVGRWFNLSPVKLHDLQRATWNNIEHLAIDFVVTTLRPWLIRIEQEVSRKLILDGERHSYFAEHLVDVLLRGDTASRYAVYQIALQNKVLTINEVRELENRNPVPWGDEFETPAPEPQEKENPDEEKPDDDAGDTNDTGDGSPAE
jgi:HK97 family phage portal protein